MSEHITFREGTRKAALRSSFYHPSRCEERQERGNHEPLVSLRKPGSAEQVQFFSQMEASARRGRERVTCERRSEKLKKKLQKNTCTPMHTKVEKPRKTF